MTILSSDQARAGSSLREVPRRFLSERKLAHENRGNVLFYILIAIALMGALTYSFAKDSRTNLTTQMGHKASEELYIQASLIRAAILECSIQYPQGGGDMDNNGVVDASDNPNNPYPINPSSALILRAPAGCTTTSNATGCVSAAANDQARNMVCVGAPIGQANIFQGANNKGRFLPPPPSGFGEWEYLNDTNGVRIRITAGASAIGSDALARLQAKFANCQADVNYGACGTGCMTIWVQRTACP